MGPSNIPPGPLLKGGKRQAKPKNTRRKLKKNKSKKRR